MLWYVYMILTEKNKLYTGVSSDPERRFYEHLFDFKKRAKFFRSDSPSKIVYLENFQTKGEALSREIVIKKLKRQQKEELIRSKNNLCTSLPNSL